MRLREIENVIARRRVPPTKQSRKSAWEQRAFKSALDCFASLAMTMTAAHQIILR
jgi:hypothetical protein